MILDEPLGRGDLLVLDGAIGSEVERLGARMDAIAWCGLANRDHPDIVRQVHAEYLRAGANIVTANTFATCRHVIAANGDGDACRSVTASGVQLCREAIDEVGADRPVAVAGSMSNQVAWIPGTLSPDPAHAPTPETEAANYREHAEVLAEAGADLLLLEMMQDVDHASRLVEAASTVGLPLWIGISCSITPNGEAVAWDQHLEEPAHHLDPSQPSQRRRLPLSRVVEAMLDCHPQVMGIMHSRSTSVQTGLDAIRERWSGPLMAYPESTNHHAVDPATFAKHCQTWADSGVQIIGGCCGTTIDHIRTMVNEITGELDRGPEFKTET